jgi:hypothetical protein
VESTKPSEIAPPSAATSQVVRDWVSISIVKLLASLYCMEYIVAADGVQPGFGLAEALPRR